MIFKKKRGKIDTQDIEYSLRKKAEFLLDNLIKSYDTFEEIMDMNLYEQLNISEKIKIDTFSIHMIHQKVKEDTLEKFFKHILTRVELAETKTGEITIDMIKNK